MIAGRAGPGKNGPMKMRLLLLLFALAAVASAQEVATLYRQALAAEQRRDYRAAHRLYARILTLAPKRHDCDLRRDELEDLLAWQKGLAGRRISRRSENESPFRPTIPAAPSAPAMRIKPRLRFMP